MRKFHSLGIYINAKIYLIIIFLIVFACSFSFELKQTKDGFDERTNFWQTEINSALLSNDWVAAAKYLKSIVDSSLQGAELVVQNRIVFSTKSNFDPSKCLIVWITHIKQYQTELGSIKSCPDLPRITLLALMSPFFVVITLFSLVVMALSSSVTLVKYKKGVLGIIDVLSKAHDEKDDTILSVNKDQLSAGDAIVNRTIGLMQSLFQERLNRETSENRAKAARKISMLAASFAHDIRSPLSALRIATQSDLTKPGVKELVELSAIRITSISDQLLKDAKGSIEEDTEISITKDLRRIHLQEDVVAHVVKEKQLEIWPKSGISIIVQSTLGKDDFIIGDQIQLQRILSNLINNSIDAFENGSGSIVISLSVVNKSIELLVCDNGSGIPDDILSKVGTFGYSHGKSSSRSGSGIGVYFAQKVVRECGGSFEISSKVKHGTIVKIQFPHAGGQVLRPIFTAQESKGL